MDPELVRKARAVELEYFETMRVYTRVPRDHQRQSGGKILRCRCVDTTKGDAARPNSRSRLVGLEFRTDPDNSLYSGTPLSKP